MTLTLENMKTDPTGDRDDYGALVQDLLTMDESQLEKYVRLGFQDQINPEFLPEHTHFWRAFSIYGDNDGGSPPTPGTFFGNVYAVINETLAGDYNLGFIPSNKEFQTRLETILQRILTDCIDHRGKLTEKEKMLARFSVEAVRSTIFNDRYGIVQIPNLVALCKTLKRDTRYSAELQNFHFS